MKMRGRLLYKGIVGLMLGFLLLMAALLGREFWRGRINEPKYEAVNIVGHEQWKEWKIESQEEWEDDFSCVYIYDDDEQSLQALEQMETVLAQMKVSSQFVKAEEFQKEMLKNSDTVVFSVTKLREMGERMMDVVDWVKNGGNLLMLYLPGADGYLETLMPMLGLRNIGEEYHEVTSLSFSPSFMPGGSILKIQTTYAAAHPLQVTDGCEIYLESNETYPLPLIWKHTYEKGSVVVSNLGYLDTRFRGFYAAAYSLLGEGFAYPVINGSAYLIDDFPAPAADGSSGVITRDYKGTDNRHFIEQIWWEDLYDLAEKYSVRYTGAVLEQYNGETDGTVTRNQNYAGFQYLGNALINSGGELAYHGYNYVPLMLRSPEGKKLWTNVQAMETAMNELVAFCQETFPDEPIHVYLPPSNMLSKEGRSLIAEKFPQIWAVCGTYFPGEEVYVQEYGVGEDGIVDIPWSTQGLLFDDETRLAALSELTFHYAGEHFLHLDELWDANPDTAEGWPEMRNHLDAFMDWFYGAATGIRRLTASEMAGAVQRYDALTVRRIWEKDALRLELGNFLDEAWLLVRLNGHQPGQVEGGKLEKVMDGFYLLKAEDAQVTIHLDEK